MSPRPTKLAIFLIILLGVTKVVYENWTAGKVSYQLSDFEEYPIHRSRYDSDHTRRNEIVTDTQTLNGGGMHDLHYHLRASHRSNQNDSKPHHNFPHLSQDRLGSLRSTSLMHGTFYFAPTSHEISVPANALHKPTWNHIQQQMLDDDAIDIEKEKVRCQRYNFGYNNRTLSKRRRLFLGTMIADESMEVIQAVSSEVYNLFHTVSIIESNVTHNLSHRKWRFGMGSDNLLKLQQLFGPKTKVSVDYYVTNLTTTNGDDLLSDYIQREGNNLRWSMNGMRPDDVAIVADCDETFSRDYLRALQVCDVPEFQPINNCKGDKIMSSTLVFESSPNCVTKDRRWFHPDAMLGECIDQIGDLSIHLPSKREWNGKHSNFKEGYGWWGNFSLYEKEDLGGNTGNYPLWFATDIRMNPGNWAWAKDGSATGFHFHNFFESAKDIHWKYLTYGHAWGGGGDRPIWEIHEDIELGVQCAHGVKNEKWLEFSEEKSKNMPIYYMNDQARDARHRHWQSIVEEDRVFFNRTVSEIKWVFHPPPTNPPVALVGADEKN